MRRAHTSADRALRARTRASAAARPSRQVRGPARADQVDVERRVGLALGRGMVGRGRKSAGRVRGGKARIVTLARHEFAFPLGSAG
jgi:hypothetical protein